MPESIRTTRDNEYHSLIQDLGMSRDRRALEIKALLYQDGEDDA